MIEDRKTGKIRGTQDLSRRAAMGAGLTAAVAVVAGLVANKASAAPLKKTGTQATKKGTSEKTGPKATKKGTSEKIGTKARKTRAAKTLPKSDVKNLPR